jgi:cardiolipin synthase A/B
MLQAAERGVRVYVLTASEQRISVVVREEEIFEERMADEQRKLLDRLAGKVLLRSAGHIHAKFLVVDPQSNEWACAWLSTANFNQGLRENLDLGVSLDAAAARALAACFHWGFWREAERELREPGRLSTVKANFPGVPPFPTPSTIFTTLSDSTALRDRVVSLINDARDEILIASYGVEADHITVRALCEASKRGVKVSLLTRPRPAVAAGVAALAAAGASVFAHDRLHAKALVADGKTLVMSANLQAQGLDSGFEVGVMLSPPAAGNVEATLRDWGKTFPWEYRINSLRGEYLGDFCPVDATLRDGVKIVTDTETQRVPKVIANDALQLNDAPLPSLRPKHSDRHLPKRMIITWEVFPPNLPKEARERFREIEQDEFAGNGTLIRVKRKISYEPQVFTHGSAVYVVLRTEKEVEPARQLAAELGAKVVLP